MRLKIVILMLLLITALGADNIYAKKQGKALVDSLLQALPAMPDDSVKATLIANISLLCQPIDPDKGITVANQGLDLSTSIGWKKGIASSFSSLAANYSAKSDYTKTLEYLFKALKIEEEINDKQGEASSYNNIGIVYENQEDLQKALGYYTKALKLQEELANKPAITIALGNIATIYFNLKDYTKALDFDQRAMSLAQELGDKSGVATYLEIIGDIYNAQRNYHAALESDFHALKIAQELEDDNNVATCLGYIGQFYLNFVRDSVHYTPDSLIPPSKAAALKMSVDYLTRAIVLCNKIGFRDGVQDFSRHLSEALEESGNYKDALSYFKQFMVIKDSIFNTENNVKITNLETRRELDLKDKQIEIDKLAVAKKRNERGFLIAGIVGLLILCVIVFRNYKTQLANNKMLSVEKQKSEDLLLNILPEEVAEELKEKGVANAKQFEDVTVLFTDFVNFTEASERMSPQQLVGELHTCFKAFDEMLGKYNAEKIKTVGDAYLAVSGLPVSNPGHAVDMVAAAIEIRNYMIKRKTEMGDLTFDMRIGIHSGPVVAGIVGVKKFAYDIWGDTVNTAARMEQHGEKGKINISGTTYELIKQKFNCEYRGELPAKNKGNMKMYFVLD